MPDKKRSVLGDVQFPPVPAWKPAIVQPIERIIDCVARYTHYKQDFAVFTHSTCAMVTNGFPDDDAVVEAKRILDKIYNFHPDIHPRPMQDGNIVVQYNWPALNLVLSDVVKDHWEEIVRNYRVGLATFEIIGGDRSSDLFKKLLFGRCYMFMDAQAPQVVRIVRSAPNAQTESGEPALQWDPSWAPYSRNAGP